MRKSTEDLVFTIFALLVVAHMFERLPFVLEEKFGIVIGDGSQGNLLVAGAAVGLDTPLGTRVNTPSALDFFSEAGGKGSSTGTFAPGTSLIIRDGPVEDASGNRWWYVEDPATGKRGWVPESALVREGVGGIGPLTTLGTRARALLDTDLWTTPGALTSLGRMKLGDWGTLSDGPTFQNGGRWWFFDRDDTGVDGWVPESALTLYSETGWRKGSAVRATRDTDMYERAGGGGLTGLLSEDEKGKIVGGPVLVGGVYWWLVETKDGERGWVPESALEDAGIRGWLRGILATAIMLGAIITVGLLSAIVYVTVRTNQIRAREAQRIKSAVPSSMKQKRNERWDKVLEHVASENPNDWRLAIIEADIMLDEVVTRMGYHGGSLGEKLKLVAKGDMKSLDAAWEAHRVRNQVAHEGSDFILTQREAKRVVDLYGVVFQELKYT